MKRSSGADRVADTGKQPGRLLILTVQGASGAHKALSVDVAGGRSCEDGAIRVKWVNMGGGPAGTPIL